VFVFVPGAVRLESESLPAAKVRTSKNPPRLVGAHVLASGRLMLETLVTIFTITGKISP
jgi:hypothetical protein